MENLTSATPVPETETGILTEPLVYRVVTTQSVTYLADRLTYWQQLYPGENPFINQFTRQVRREATSQLGRNGIALEQLQAVLPFQQEIPLPNRRNLRYGPHGIHEYRGKFFPQLVRSLLNIAGVSPASLILDPMCGSGTTPTEAALLGCQAIGLDLNPLSVLMSRAKYASLTIQPDELIKAYQSFKGELLHPATSSAQLPWLESLPPQDQAYLTNWFAPQVVSCA
ncbi:MAG: hypothetical protein HC875_33830 [Anaerolineales bacterium]|nr:hypothetical protein [Anaerolineales bacterium]